MHLIYLVLSAQAVQLNVMKPTSPAASTTSGVDLVLLTAVQWVVLMQVETVHLQHLLHPHPIAGLVVQATNVSKAPLAIARTPPVMPTVIRLQRRSVMAVREHLAYNRRGARTPLLPVVEPVIRYNATRVREHPV